MKPDRLVGDTACGTGPVLEWMVQDKGIAPHVPVWDRTERKDGTVVYRASQHVCTGCPIKQQCCPNTLHRKITRSVRERSRDVARELANTVRYKQSRRDRKKVEILFAHLKRILKLDRLRLRGLTGAHDEFVLAATAQNLRRMAKRLFEGQQGTAAMPA